MNSAIQRLAATVVVWTSAMLVFEHRLAAQPLPEPVDDEAGYDLPPPPDSAPAAQPAPSGRPRLGITLDPRFRAAVVRSVVPGGAAEHAGLEPGDIIEALNGRRMASYRDVLDFVDATRPGDIIDIDFSRRITGRTQAVLDAAPLEERTAGYGQRDTYRRETARNGRVPAQPRELDPGDRQSDDDRSADRDARPRDRQVDRDREREDRGRGRFRRRRG